MSTVLVTYSSTNGGSAISSDIDGGSVGNGEVTTADTVYVRHDGDNSITSCKFYIAAINERYLGAATADGDLSEVLGWGDGATAAAFGGFFLNLDASGGFPAGSWPSLANKSVTSGLKTVGAACRTGVGDSASNGISLITNMGCSSDETIQTGTSPNVRFQCKASVPSAEDTVGLRHIKLVLSYSYTS